MGEQLEPKAGAEVLLHASHAVGHISARKARLRQLDGQPGQRASISCSKGLPSFRGEGINACLFAGRRQYQMDPTTGQPPTLIQRPCRQTLACLWELHGPGDELFILLVQAAWPWRQADACLCEPCGPHLGAVWPSPGSTAASGRSVAPCAPQEWCSSLQLRRNGRDGAAVTSCSEARPEQCQAWPVGCSHQPKPWPKQGTQPDNPQCCSLMARNAAA